MYEKAVFLKNVDIFLNFPHTWIKFEYVTTCGDYFVYQHLNFEKMLQMCGYHQKHILSNRS